MSSAPAIAIAAIEAEEQREGHPGTEVWRCGVGIFTASDPRKRSADWW